MLKDRLKELRLKQGLTQEEVGKELCVTAQSVSKWERGIVSPDISLLPRISLLYGCSLDSLFEMESYQTHRRTADFREQLRRLKANHDHRGVFDAYVEEIHRRPEAFFLYVDWMRYCYQNKYLSDPCLFQIFSVTEYALTHCQEPDQRNEIFKWLITLCACSDDPAIREKGKEIYQKIPSIKHSREIFAKIVLEEEEAFLQIRKNIIRCIDIAECAVRQLIKKEMPAEEKLFYYKKASALYEVILQDGFGGFWDPPYVVDCTIVASLLAQSGKLDEAKLYLNKAFSVMERHLHPEQCIPSPLLAGTAPENGVPFEKKCKEHLLKMVQDPGISVFHKDVIAFGKRYYAHFGFDASCFE